jgi:hypothetical protein
MTKQMSFGQNLSQEILVEVNFLFGRSFASETIKHPSLDYLKMVVHIVARDLSEQIFHYSLLTFYILQYHELSSSVGGQTHFLERFWICNSTHLA